MTSRPQSRPALTLLSTLLLLAAAMPASAVTIPTSTACPAGTTALLGTTAGEKLKAGKTPSCILADEGDDKIKGGPGSDLLDAGMGIDKTTGGKGDDVLVIRAACEVGPREVIKGGRGTDTLRSPLSIRSLEALGVKVRGIEVFELVASGHDGGCAETDTGTICTCCNTAGLDREAACEECSAGFVRNDLVRATADLDQTSVPRGTCEAVETCATSGCGSRGTCADTAEGAVCRCDDGYAGASCDACAPMYEHSADGRCVLGLTCATERCGNRGRCVSTDGINITCHCDEGFEDSEDCGGSRAVVGGPPSVDAGGGPYTYGVMVRGDGHCTGRFEWTLSGPGSLDPTGDSTHATYTPPTTTDGEVDTARVEAKCSNNEEVGGRFDVTITRPGSAAPSRGRVNGYCDEAFEPFDEEVLSFINRHEIPGATLAIMYREQVMCVKGYGYAELSGAGNGGRPMNNCTPLRLASVSKPFIRAAFRGALYGTSMNAADGGGILGDSTPVLPILDEAIGLGAGGQVPWQADESLYDENHPAKIDHESIDITCSFDDGLINPHWQDVTVGDLLNHTAGFQPNMEWRFSPDTGACLGEEDEICGDWDLIADTTVVNGTMRRIPNDLSLDHGVLTRDDVLQFTAGTCPYDDPAQDRYRYSNIGFTIAGKVIEELINYPYDQLLNALMESTGVIGLDLPGRPILYEGKWDVSAPDLVSLPDDLEEGLYYSGFGNQPNLNAPVFSSGQWTYPTNVAWPNSFNFEVMGPHGGLVANALALVKLGTYYRIDTGKYRTDPLKYPNVGGISHAGRLAGTFSWLWEMETADFANANNPNGAGCLRPADKSDSDDPAEEDKNGLNVLEVEPCPIPEGIRVAVVFNREDKADGTSGFVRGLHDWTLLLHQLRYAASQVGADADAWNKIEPVGDKMIDVGCGLKCLEAGPCVPEACGNGSVDDGEECDDGDNEGGDSCLPDCTDALDVPAGYLECEGLNPGSCIGGPCAPRQENGPFADGDTLDPQSQLHPDGDWSRHEYCEDPGNGEATCVRTTVIDKDFGVCQECGVGTMIGCLCPAPNAEDGGCNIDGVSSGLTCTGGRCWDELPPEWMCTADCDEDIYGTGGHCNHDDKKGAVCEHLFCDEPIPGFCGEIYGQVCDITAPDCPIECDSNDPENCHCCNPECLDDDDCTTLGYEPGHQCIDERCKLQ